MADTNLTFHLVNPTSPALGLPLESHLLADFLPDWVFLPVIVLSAVLRCGRVAHHALHVLKIETMEIC